MAENSKIEWCHHTFNPWRGCTKVSDGCTHCYADRDSVRNPNIRGVWGKYGTRVIASDAMWREPLRWNKNAAKAGVRERVFCASLADVFEAEDTMPEASRLAVDVARLRLFELIDKTKNLDWLLLTKRPENVPEVLWKISQGTYGGGWNLTHMPNVWLGTSVEDQKTADERIPKLLSIPAAVRWLSMEPLLGPVDLGGIKVPYQHALGTGHLFWNTLNGFRATSSVSGTKGNPAVDWVIVGGESGPAARPTHPDWVRSIRDQCQAAGVPFFFKQWGEWLAYGQTSPYCADPGRGDEGEWVEFHEPENKTNPYERIMMRRVGKKKAGRLLDGREWNEYPGASDNEKRDGHAVPGTGDKEERATGGPK